MTFRDFLDYKKTKSKLEVEVFELELSKIARKIPIMMVSSDHNMNNPGYTTSKGIFLNKNFFKNGLNLQKLFFIILHEVCHFLEYEEFGESYFDIYDKEFEDFFEIMLQAEIRADNYAELKLNEINNILSKKNDVGSFKQRFNDDFFYNNYKSSIRQYFNNYHSNIKK